MYVKRNLLEMLKQYKLSHTFGSIGWVFSGRESNISELFSWTCSQGEALLVSWLEPSKPSRRCWRLLWALPLKAEWQPAEESCSAADRKGLGCFPQRVQVCGDLQFDGFCSLLRITVLTYETTLRSRFKIK